MDQMTKTLKNSYTYKRSKIPSLNRALYKEISRNYGYKCAICGWSVPSHTPNGGLQKQNGCDELREYVKTEPQTGIDWLKENYKSLYK